MTAKVNVIRIFTLGGCLLIWQKVMLPAVSIKNTPSRIESEGNIVLFSCLNPIKRPRHAPSKTGGVAISVIKALILAPLFLVLAHFSAAYGPNRGKTIRYRVWLTLS